MQNKRLKSVNECILNYTEYDKIDKQVLKDEAIIDDISMSPNGDFHIIYILKTYYYMINLEGNINGELKKAYLE